jgi:ATP-binding cassette subfamily B protein
VDSETESLVQEALEVLFAGRSSIVIAHRLSTIIGSDRIITIHKGKIREEGTHRELLRKDGIYSKLYRLAGSTGIQAASSGP